MTVFYVSPLGNDSSTGLSADVEGGNDGPFLTLARAQAAMRANPGADTTLIRDGTYALTAPLALTSADSNSTFAAYQNETPTISGGTAVTGWTVGADGVWSAHVSANDVEQLTVNGVSQTEARYPNAVPSDPIKGGWLWAKDLPSGDPSRELAYNKSDFASGPPTVGEKVTVFSTEGYSSDVLTITKVDASAGIITFDQDASYELGAGSRYFISDSKVLLDQAGEWYFDPASHTMYFRPPAGFTGSGAVASGDTSLITINGAQNVNIQGLTFSDAATKMETDDITTAAITINSSTGVVVDHNHFSNVAQGVFVSGSSNHNTISNNDFSNLWSVAVNMRPGTHENTVTNNTITHSGEVFRTSGAIQMDETWGNIITHNLIQDVPRFGIGENNYDPGQKSGGNIIEYNEILHSGQETPDVGAIYLYSHLDPGALGDTIDYNKIVDAGGLGTTASGFIAGANQSNGIYLDDYASNAQIIGNFIQGTAFSGIYIHGGKGVEISGNVIVDSQQYGVQLTDIDGTSMAGDKVHGNIIEVPADQSSNAIDLDRSMVAPANVYQNIYFSSNGANPHVADLTYSKWLAAGGDVGSSVVVDPGFANPNAGDFSLGSGSFALSHGFHDLPWADIGPSGDVAVTMPTLQATSVILQNGTDGQVLFADVSDGTLQSWGLATGALGSDWKAVGIGDVNPANGGGAEVFFQQQSTGSISYASLDTGTTTWGIVTAAITPDWQLRAVADVTGDGSADAIVQSVSTGTIEFVDMKNGVFHGWNIVSTGLTPDFAVVGAGDINHDGFADIVVQDAKTGSIYFADMANGKFNAWDVVSTNLSTDWTVKAVADVTGDGFADIVIQNSAGTGGATLYADMKNGVLDHWGVVASGLTSDWTAQGTADINNDGHADVLFENHVTQMTVAAEVNGSGTGTPTWVSVTDPTPGWHVV